MEDICRGKPNSVQESNRTLLMYPTLRNLGVSSDCE